MKYLLQNLRRFLLYIQSVVQSSHDPRAIITNEEIFLPIYSSNSEVNASDLLEYLERKVSSLLHTYTYLFSGLKSLITQLCVTVRRGRELTIHYTYRKKSVPIQYRKTYIL